MQTQRRLNDILSREIVIQWFESIALVQAVCEEVLTHGSSDGFPSAADIAVDVDGSIAVLGQAGGPTVASAGHLLAGMVGDDVPVRLRLAISAATATESPYRHLAAFSEALAYFERPGRRELITALYARAVSAPSRSIARSIEARTPAVPDNGQTRQARPGRRRLPLVPASLVAGAVVAAGIWLVTGDRQMPAALAALVPDARPEQNLAPPAAVRPRRGEPHPHAKTVEGRVRREKLVPNQATTPSDVLLPVTRDVSPTIVFHERLEVVASEPGERNDVSTGEVRPRIYSRDDAFVSPPRAVRPQLPSEPPFDPTAAPPTEIELVIDATGVVESAKLRSAPRNITEFMLLSAAKAWVFRPAQLEGRPVTYRYRVRLILP
jgi:hypothetical protein